MGAHVSASPNHQVHRITSLKTRGDVAIAGQFGYELDIEKLPQDELDEIKEQIKLYKKYVKLFITETCIGLNHHSETISVHGLL